MRGSLGVDFHVAQPGRTEARWGLGLGGFSMSSKLDRSQQVMAEER